MSNRLPTLAAEIRKAHADVQEAAKTAAERAIDAGNALIEAKALCGHGEWLPWLRENCALAERTAQLYMKVAKSGLKAATIAVLGLAAAAKAVVLNMADPFAGDTDEALHEWTVYMLWGVVQGRYAPEAEHYCEWLRRNDWESPTAWMGAEGEKYRSRIGLGSISSKSKKAWAAFLAKNLDTPKSELNAEIQRRFASQTEPARPTDQNRRRPRRRMAA